MYPIWFYSALVITLVVQGLLTRVGSRRGADEHPPDVWQAAFVAGGYRRVVDTAIAGLAMRDQVLVSRRGRLTVATGATPGGPIESVVCLALGGTTSRRAVLRRLRSDPALLAVETQARSLGLMLGGARAVWWRLVMLPLLAIAGVGLVRAIDGVDVDRLARSLVQVLVIAGVIVAVLSIRLRVRHRPSPVGREVVRRLGRAHESRPRPVGGVLAGVAAFGFNAVEDDDLRWALKKSAGTARAGGD